MNKHKEFDSRMNALHEGLDDLIRRAASFARNHLGRLVRKMGLKAAMERYHYVVRKIGMTGEKAPHSLRYQYATEHLRRMKAAGVSRREAAAQALPRRPVCPVID